MLPHISILGAHAPSYAVALLGATWLCWGLIVLRTRKRGWQSPRVLMVLAGAFPFGALGGRIMASLAESLGHEGATTPGYSGMTALGAIAAVLVFVLWSAPRLVHVAGLRFLDACAFSLPLSQGVGRLGCLALGCCYGSPVESGGLFTVPLRAYTERSAPHQMFDAAGVETLWNLPLLFVVQAALGLVIVEVFYRQRGAHGRAGVTVCVALLMDALGRVVLEGFRGGPWSLTAARNPWQDLSWLYLALVAAFAIALVRRTRAQTLVSSNHG